MVMLPQRPTCRGCRILRVELVRLQRESESRAAADAQRCLAMYDHMERLARLNMALTQRRKTSTPIVQPLIEVDKPVRVAMDLKDSRVDERSSELDEQVQRLQAMVVQQTREIERLMRQLKSSVPMLQLDGAKVVAGAGNDSNDDDDCDDNQDIEFDGDERGRRRRRGLEKLPLTSLHAQLRARDATIHRLEHHVTELTEALDASREKKSHATAQYQQITKSQQSQLKKCAARIEEQQRMVHESEREIDGLKAYVSVLEKKLLAKKAASERATLAGGGEDGRRFVRLLEPRDDRYT